LSERSIVDVSPCKQFFISSLTKDITLINCIFDLVDNAISGVEKENSKNDCKISDYRGFSIYIDFGDNHFFIRDNCGGIEVNHAKNYVFKFGNDLNNTPSYASSGFGIGMKRAFFKIGNKIQLISCTRNSRIQVNIDVLKWLKEAGWNLEIKHDDRTYEDTGTTIKITKLNREVLSAFRNENFKSDILENLRKKYSKKISNGLKIFVNNTQIVSNIKIQDRYYSEFCTIGKASATIEIFKCNASSKELGWYIYFNDLNVVKANKDKVTGWENNSEIGNLVWDNEFFDGFYGVVSCKSQDIRELPLMTTKEINIETEFYHELKEKMIFAVKECKDRFGDNECESTTIQYKKPKKEVEQLKESLGVNSAAEVGRETFDYYCENNL
jgi:hypothetical protein